MSSFNGGNDPSIEDNSEEVTPFTDSELLEELRIILIQQHESDVTEEELRQKIENFKSYWTLQQSANLCAKKIEVVAEKKRLVELRHKNEENAERAQRLAMQHDFRLKEEQRKRERATELDKIHQELAERGKEWNVVAASLNIQSKDLYTRWTNSVSRKSKGPSVNQLIQKVIQRLHQRMEIKKVCATTQPLQTRQIKSACRGD